MEEHRIKRAKATSAEIAEPSSSRALNEDFRNLGDRDVPLMYSRGNPFSNSEAAHLAQSSLSISMAVVNNEGNSEEIAPRSINGEISVISHERSLVSHEQEDPEAPSADGDAIMRSPLHRNNSTAGVDDQDEASRDPAVVINTPSQQNPSTAEQGETTVSADMLIDGRISDTVAVNEHGEARAQLVVAIQEGAVQEDAAVVADKEAGHATSTRVAPDSSKNVSNMGEESAPADHVDGVNCPICMEPWTGEGLHRICCLACGHLFGRSCIRRWLNQRGRKNGKCPHCNRKARIEDIRDLYVPCLSVIDDKSQQLHEELGMLRLRNEELILQNDKLNQEFDRLKAMLISSHPREIPRGNSHQHHTTGESGLSGPSYSSNNQARSKQNFFMKRSSNSLQECTRWEYFAAGKQTSSYNSFHAHGIDTYGSQQAPQFPGNECPVQFQLQEEFSLPGARVFDMDAFSQMLLVAQKPSAVGGFFCLNKLSLLSLSDALVMPLPQCTGAVRDVRIGPPGGKLPGRLALVASLGKLLSLFSLESNNVVLTYKLQSPCWSCAWDPNEPYLVFAGLQDGTLTIFDLRQTSSPLKSLQSDYRQPIHTLHPVNECNLPQSQRRNGILSACSSGVCFWDSSALGLHDSRPQAIPFADTQSICVALAYNQLANAAVATFRERPLVHQQGPPHHASEAESTSGLASQSSSQLNLGFPPLRAAHYPILKNAGTSLSSWSALPCEDVCGRGWEYGSPMLGHVSPVGMHRSSIVCSLRSASSSDLQSVFAFGDEETHALMLWDFQTLTILDRLKPHSSPILDVRSMNIGEHAILGCTSGATLQLYKR